MYRFAYDLDGTLVSTRAANLAAYHKINVEPPPNFHQLPWKAWCDQRTHDLKNTVLPDYAHLFKPLPLLDFARGNCGPILSMCSKAAFMLILERFPDIAEISGGVVFGMTERQRLDTLISLQPRLGVGFYFDDNPAFCTVAANANIGWTICQVYPE